ncbi:hypothetical protein KBY97_14375 [Synechococcus sp. ATX 2A4]|nr:hypothetical protein [Synechococcus sp. ATX 2A4]
MANGAAVGGVDAEGLDVMRVTWRDAGKAGAIHDIPGDLAIDGYQRLPMCDGESPRQQECHRSLSITVI